MGHNVHQLIGEEVWEALDEVHDAIILRDFEDRIVYWSKGAERLYGWWRHEVVGRNLYDVLRQTDAAAHANRTGDLTGKGEWVGELRHITKDEREVIVLSRCKLIRDEAELPRFVLIANTDLTDKVLLEQRLFHAAGMESVGRLACSVAHDLANALSPIVAGIGILRQQQLDEEGKQWIEYLHAGTTYAIGLVAQLLSLGKVTEGHRVSLEPGSVVTGLLPILKSAIPESIQIKIEIAPDLWTVVANLTNLQQAILNVCLNARDAMPQGGMLEIEARNAVLDRPCARHVCIRVKDNGCGIPEEIRHKIMNPFFTTKKPEHGTGLGLFSVFKIVEDHSGFVNVSTEFGSGTAVELYIPVEDSI